MILLLIATCFFAIFIKYLITPENVIDIKVAIVCLLTSSLAVLLHMFIEVDPMVEMCKENTPEGLQFVKSLFNRRCDYESLPNLPYKKCIIIFEESRYHGIQEVSRNCTS